MTRQPQSGDVVNRIARSTLRAVLFFALTGAAAAQDYTWQIESSITYETGEYGTDHATKLLYWPVTAKWLASRGDVSLTVPYLDLSGANGRTVIDGSVVEGNGSGGSGLGDVSCKARYNWIEQSETMPFIDLVARLKLPTADDKKGLGTGEIDIGFGAEVARRFAAAYIVFLDLTYTVIGDPPGVNYHNRIDTDLGLGYQFTQKLMGSVSCDFRSAISPGGSDAKSLSFLANYKVSPRVRTYGMIELGFSDGAPDYGITVGASCRF